MAPRGSYKLKPAIAGLGLGAVGWMVITSPGVREFVATPAGTATVLVVVVVLLAMIVKN